jgi:hypothetical protein
MSGFRRKKKEVRVPEENRLHSSGRTGNRIIEARKPSNELSAVKPS